jgi:PKD repeat protein
MLVLNGLRSWLLAFATIVAACAALPAAAGAAAYGQLSSFGSAGVGVGQFTEESQVTAAFGVDSTDNSVYVGDKPSNKVFRIQKFSSSGTFLGEARIESVPGESALEGIAVDSAEKRFYALVVQTRSPEATVDPEFTAAGALYSFSTEPTEEGGKKVLSGGLLASKSVLKPASAVAGESLLEPSGLAVDPKSHDIILAGSVDPTGSEETVTALERVSKTGVLVPNERWVDNASTPFFGTEIATSPVVNAEGKVYVVGGPVTDEGEQIDEIPSKFASQATPKTFIKYEPGELELVSFPGIPAALQGGGLSLAPDGTLWVYAKILSPGEGKHPGALSFATSGGTPTVQGWTGGQTLKLGTGKCVISFFGHPMVAAGKENQLFMFDPDSSAPQVIKFGEGGEGCPSASATPLEAFEGAVKKEGSDVIKPGAEVQLSSTLAAANALKVTWNFGDRSEAVTTNQHQSPTVLHKFIGEGKFKVTATIATDNLATPTIVLERTLTVSKPLPVARFTAVNPIVAGVTDTFDAKNSTGVEKAAITEYRWNFGDGSAPVTTTTAATTHVFATEGHYPVTLQVVDANKLVSEPESQSIAVTAAVVIKPPPPPPPPPPTTTTGTTPPPGKGGVLPYTLSVPASTITASNSGALTLKINCTGQSSCTGTATLKTVSAVSAGKHKKKLILTLASGSFNTAGGHVQAITLHLSAAARTLLAHSGSRGLRVRVMIVARDSAGTTHSMQTLLTIHAAKAKKHH